MIRQIIAIIILIIALVLILIFVPKTDNEDEPMDEISTFTECVEAGNPVMESYPRQCRTPDGELFVEDVGNVLEKLDLVRLESPLPNEVIESPLTITGEARGFWFFEASFPIVLTNWDGLIIAEGFATAEGEWMTTEFVPFEATLEFTSPTEEATGSDIPEFLKRGFLILQKDNPSGLPENDDALEIPIFFAE